MACCFDSKNFLKESRISFAVIFLYIIPYIYSNKNAAKLQHFNEFTKNLKETFGYSQKSMYLCHG